MSLFRLSAAPDDATPVERKNFVNVQIDAIGVGLASAAAPFLPVFLTRLGASNLQVGLLTSMPAFTGLLLAIIVGRFLQTRRQIVPWFSVARFMVISCYALTGFIPFIVPREYAVQAVLVIWALATFPQIIINVAFSVVMNAVAGPQRRYDLLSRRWSLLGLTTALTVAGVGQVLDQIAFPFNYQIVFMTLSIGGLISLYYSSHIELPDAQLPASASGQSLAERVKGYVNLIRGQPAFVSFTAKRFVYFAGSLLAVPLFPIYYVREVHASDAWIGIISTSQTAVIVIGYFLWSRQSRARGSRFVLLCTTLALALYPVLTGLTRQVEWIVLYAGLAGFFQGGLDLVFFDELMKTIPPKYSATFVSLAQSTQYVITVAAPLVGTLLADQIGVGGALIVSGALRLIAFVLFALPSKQAGKVQVRQEAGS
ncbi:MAG: MFS transporter [Chloroflexi bacterium]|nr:MFS transporter [Chloroflexota bacterium]